MSLRSLQEAIRAPWIKRAGLASNLSGVDVAMDRTFTHTWANPTSGQPPVYGVGVDPNGALTVGGSGMIQPLWQPAVYSFAANAGLADQHFFIANQRYLVRKILQLHATAGGSTPTCVIRKCTSGQAVTAGVSLQSGSFDLAATANTLQTATLVSNEATLTLEVGDRLAIDYSGTLTSLAGVCAVVFLQPLGGVPTLDITYAVNANATLADAQFFVANDRYLISSIRYCHGTAGSSTPVVQVTKDTSTNAPGTGTDLLTNTTNTGFNCAATANVVQVGVLATTAGLTLLAQGDRLSVDFAGTLTALADVVITISLIPLARRTEVTYFFTGASVNTDQAFFIADRDYNVRISTEVHAVAAGGASTAQIVKDTGTDAPGTGTDLLLAAFDLNGTAQTVDPDLMAAAPYTTRLRSGDRLSIDFANAVQSGTGVLVTVGLDAI